MEANNSFAADAVATPRLSVIVPFFNEEANIVPMHAAIVDAVAVLGIPFEMVFVDDGSRDATFERAVALARQDPRLRVVKFRRNYGQTAAMAAGIENARGDVLITMDGDLQNDPADIEHFLKKIDEGYDIVVGWRHRRQDKLFTRKIPSKIANFIIGKVTGVPITDNGCSLKAFRAPVIKSVSLYSEMHRFIPAMAWITGPRIAEIKVRHHARRFGTSKYGLSRIYKVLLDLMVIKTIGSFTSQPLLWFTLLSLPLLALGITALAAGILPVLWDHAPIALPLAGTGVMFLSSAMFLLAGGALGELIYKTGDIREHKLAELTVRLFRS